MAVVFIAIYAIAFGTLALADPSKPWWIIGVLLGSYSLYGIYAARGQSCSVGADWLQTTQGWVRLYELVYIASNRQGIISLVDKEGRRIDIRINDLCANQDVWDFTYNGIRHSMVANKAETNSTLRRLLNIPT